MSFPTKEQLKARSKHLAQLLQDKYNLKVSHGHCLDLVSKLFGFKNWNTANAACPEIETATPDSTKLETPWLKVLNEGFHLCIDQPYLKERFHVGGASAQHSTERGVTSLPFTIRIDEQSQRVILELPLSTAVSTSESEMMVDKVRQRYRQREASFAEKLGGKAEDLAKSSMV